MKHYFILILLISVGNLLNAKKLYDTYSPQYQYVNTIYKQVKLAYQEENINLPIKVYDEYTELYAIACVRTDTLRFNYETVDSCFKYLKDTTQVSNIIAYILGHEFSHYIHKDKIGGFACALYNQTPFPISDTNSLHQLELQRDKEGHFYARVAGFRPNENINVFFNKIYPQLVENNSIYPQNHERLKVIEDTYKEADRLYHIFEVANFLTLLGYYEEAANIYEYLIQHFPSREMYYNAACINLCWINAKMGKSDIIFDLGLTLETNTSIRGDDELSKEKINDILLKVENYLQKSKDLGNFSFYNDLIKLYLQHFIDINTNEPYNYEKYIKNILLIQDKYDNKEEVKAMLYNYLGVINYHYDKKEESIFYFKNADSLKNIIAHQNLIKMSEIKSSCKKGIDLKEDELLFYKKQLKNNYFELDTLETKLIYNHFVNKNTDSYLLNINDKELLYIEQYQNITTKKGISIGNNILDIEEKYGTCYTTFLTTNGKIILLESYNLIFILSSEDKITKIIRYQ